MSQTSNKALPTALV